MKSNSNEYWPGVTQSDTAAPPPFIPDFDVGSGSELLVQMERAFQRAPMLRHAMLAAQHLAAVVDLPPLELDSKVRDLSKLSLIQRVDQTDAQSMAMAVASAAIMTVAKAGGQTALEKVERAIELLSERYQADW